LCFRHVTRFNVTPVTSGDVWSRNAAFDARFDLWIGFTIATIDALDEQKFRLATNGDGKADGWRFAVRMEEGELWRRFCFLIGGLLYAVWSFVWQGSVWRQRLNGMGTLIFLPALFILPLVPYIIIEQRTAL
jgi:hypothetical protein